MTVNVYERYYEAKGSFSGVERNGALVMLISDSYDGMISYQAAVTFFRHMVKIARDPVAFPETMPDPVFFLLDHVPLLFLMILLS